MFLNISKFWKSVCFQRDIILAQTCLIIKNADKTKQLLMTDNNTCCFCLEWTLQSRLWKMENKINEWSSLHEYLKTRKPLTFFFLQNIYKQSLAAFVFFTLMIITVWQQFEKFSELFHIYTDIKGEMLVFLLLWPLFSFSDWISASKEALCKDCSHSTWIRMNEQQLYTHGYSGAMIKTVMIMLSPIFHPENISEWILTYHTSCFLMWVSHRSYYSFMKMFTRLGGHCSRQLGPSMLWVIQIQNKPYRPKLVRTFLGQP